MWMLLINSCTWECFLPARFDGPLEHAYTHAYTHRNALRTHCLTFTNILVMPNTPVAIVLQKILKLPLFSEAIHGMLSMVSAGDMV